MLITMNQVLCSKRGTMDLSKSSRYYTNMVQNDTHPLLTRYTRRVHIVVIGKTRKIE